MSMGGGETESQNDELIPTPQWIALPRDVTANILQRLGAVEILESAENVCSTWRRICADPAMWRVLHIDSTFAINWNAGRLENLCRRAVDHSQGQLLDLSIQNFYGQLALSVLLLMTVKFRGNVWNEAVKKLAHLEELHLIVMPSVQAEDIINIGISCPNLKSLTFNVKGFSYPSRFYTGFAGPINNKYALAIAGNMPNLSHLCLIGSPIGNEGLEAILEGCPNLESLDLRQCLDLNLHGALSKRCFEQIKLVKLPSDPVSFVEYRGAPNYSDDDYDDDDYYYYDYNDDDYYDEII